MKLTYKIQSYFAFARMIIPHVYKDGICIKDGLGTEMDKKLSFLVQHTVINKLRNNQLNRLKADIIDHSKGQKHPVKDWEDYNNEINIFTNI